MGTLRVETHYIHEIHSEIYQILPEYIFGQPPCVRLLHKENQPIFYKHLIIHFDQVHGADKLKQPHQKDFSGTSFLA